MAFIILAVLIVVIARPVDHLKGIGRWLIVSDNLEKADAIVVLGGNLPFRSSEAARLFRDGWATRVWVTAPESASELEAVKLLGLSAIPVDQLSVRVLEKFGVPGSAIRVLSPHAENTVEEIRLITAALADRGLNRVIIVTSPTHTRRARAIWRLLARPGQRAFVHHIDRERFVPDRWWKTKRDRRKVRHEIGGLAYVWLCLPVIEATGSVSHWMHSIRQPGFSIRQLRRRAQVPVLEDVSRSFLTYAAPGRLNRPNRIGIQFNRHAALEDRNGNYQTVSVLDLLQDSFQSGQRAPLNLDKLSCFEKRPGAAVRARLQHAAHGVDFCVRNRGWMLGKADNPNHTRNGENWKPLMWVESSKHIAREQGRLNFANAIRPSSAGAVKWQELFVPSVPDRD